MIYITKTEIEDKELLKDVNIYKFAKLTGYKQPYLASVKNNNVKISEKQYLKIKDLLKKHCNNL